MKIRMGLYSIAAFSVGILLAAVVGWTTDSSQRKIEKQRAVIQTQVTAAESVAAEPLKKNCGCCAERRERIQKLIQQARERRQAKQQNINTKTP